MKKEAAAAFNNSPNLYRGAPFWSWNNKDEDRWPSGFAGGLVTRDERWRARYLVFTPDSYEDVPAVGSLSANSHAQGGRTGNGRLLAAPRLLAAE